MSISVANWSGLSAKERKLLIQRPQPTDSAIGLKVAEIINRVRIDGDAAVQEFNKRFDGIEPEHLKAPGVSIVTAANACSPDHLSAINNSIHRIKEFHAAGLPEDIKMETAPGLICETRYIPISPVGLYVPGGTAPLVSTVMMLAIPAILAGCKKVVLCTPSGKHSSIHPAILAAANECGVMDVFAVGGAQAIAAMAYGTESIPKCTKIFGPGNAWVAEAKRQVSNDPDGAAQDLPAGPSEVLIIADDSADIDAVCWDLLSQAEHGSDSQAILLSDSRQLLDSVAEKLPGMASQLPRAEILAESLKMARLIQVKDLAKAMQVSNRYAPEHLILNCANADTLSEQAKTAGSVFVGPLTPESLGDYSSGTNHVLPTYGYARAYSGLSVSDFMRRMTVQTANEEGLAIAGKDAMVLAELEGLEAHRKAVEHRLETLKPT
jgi:histidinol dehydrogenase